MHNITNLIHVLLNIKYVFQFNKNINNKIKKNNVINLKFIKYQILKNIY